MEFSAVARLVSDLGGHQRAADILAWACPVPYFGNLASSLVATVGINPSNREFEDSTGRELTGKERRFPTLGSLSRSSWNEATGQDVRDIAVACTQYFDRNPYRQWFDVLERMLNAGGHSYYEGQLACHLDLVAFATVDKWGSVAPSLRRELVREGRPILGELIRDSDIRLLVLNGRSVVEQFRRFAETDLTIVEVPDWTLPRTSGAGVKGLMYQGTIDAVGGVAFGRRLHVIGYNHNLQSSFGVTSDVMRRIGQRVGVTIEQATRDRAS